VVHQKLVRLVNHSQHAQSVLFCQLCLGCARADNGDVVRTLSSVSSRLVTFVITAALALCMTSTTYARSDPPGRSDPVRPVIRVTTPGAAVRATLVTGSAWNVDDTPIVKATVQLRNLTTARIVGQTVTDDRGRFTFTNIEGGTYAVELVGKDGKVLTVGSAFVIAPGETVATFVRLGTRVPWFTGFFANAAAAAATMAASQGITALAPVQLPRSSSR